MGVGRGAMVGLPNELLRHFLVGGLLEIGGGISSLLYDNIVSNVICR